MVEFRDYVLGTECVEITPAQIAMLRGPGVYVYLSENSTAIYVGSSVSMLWRSTRKDHEHAEVLKQCHSAIFIPCKSLYSARKLEQQLIFDLRPILNKRGGMAILADALGIGSTSQAARYKQV